MQMNHPIKVQQHNNLLRWFIVLSLLAHGLILVIPADKEETNLYVNLSSPLQVTVISSRSASEATQVTEVEKASSKSQQNVDSRTLPAKRTRPASSRKKTINPEPDKLHLAKKNIASSASDKSSQSVSLTGSPVNSDTSVDVQRIPLNHLRQQLKEMIRTRFTYPRMARRMGWEGQVGLSLHIEDDGSLNQVRVARSSGHKVLDDNARKTIQGIGRIQVASNLTIQAADTEIEVLYRLTD